MRFRAWAADRSQASSSTRRGCPSSWTTFCARRAEPVGMPNSCCAPSAPTRDSPGVAAVTITRPGSTDGMVELAGGEFLMGNAGPHSYPDDGEGPVRRGRLDGFWIDACAVSNADFADFVEATGHDTEAERFGWSFVFAGLLPDEFPPTRGVAHAPWWRQVEHADWSRPGRPAVGSRRPAEPPGRTCELERHSGLLRLGRQAPADGGGVGVRGAGRARREAVPVGRRARAGRRAPHERLAGNGSRPRTRAPTASTARAPWTSFRRTASASTT